MRLQNPKLPTATTPLASFGSIHSTYVMSCFRRLLPGVTASEETSMKALVSLIALSLVVAFTAPAFAGAPFDGRLAFSRD